jgi:Kef-type K+ transport system membrane component KefB
MVSRRRRLAWLAGGALLLPVAAHATAVDEMFTRTTLLLIAMITLADWCGFLFERIGLPELVGEIFAGILLGNLALVGIDWNVSELLRSSEFMRYSSELAMVLLLFLVGLESDMRDLLRVGPNATKVAVVGVALPLFFGLFTWKVLGLDSGIEGWFVGAMLAATSVGITAGVLGAAGRISSASAKVILGAAVIDDVLGVLLLAVLASVVVTGSFSGAGLALIIFKALAFFVVTVFVGQRLMPHIIRITSLNSNASFWTGFALCMALVAAQLASFAGLAPLIGAFVAGLLLDDVHFVVGAELQKKRLEELLQPITNIMLTIFFVGIGSQVQLETLMDAQSLMVIGILFVIAVVSKGLAGFAVTGSGFDRLGIGIGMVPRGEVGLVFASFAYGHEIFCCETYSSLVMVILLTTLAGPILLKPRLARF